MTTTIVSGYRSRLLGHLRTALRELEVNGADSYRISTIGPTGAATDLVFEVDPAMNEHRDSHLVVRHASTDADVDECEFCGRSIIARFGGDVTNECDSCADEFELLNRAGKLEVNENLEDYGVRQALKEHGLLPED